MNDNCARLHELFNRQAPLHFPFEDGPLPVNGIYALFEKGEFGHEGRRIVRIGTHNGDDRLCLRLKEHFLTPNKDRSIFRKNIGLALLAKAVDPFLSQWSLDKTTRRARASGVTTAEVEKMKAVENEVSRYIRERFSFALLEVATKVDRLRWERLLIGTVSACPQCKPSPSWLGKYSPKPKIIASGLWQEQHLGGQGLSMDQISELEAMLL